MTPPDTRFTQVSSVSPARAARARCRVVKRNPPAQRPARDAERGDDRRARTRLRDESRAREDRRERHDRHRVGERESDRARVERRRSRVASTRVERRRAPAASRSPASRARAARVPPPMRSGTCSATSDCETTADPERGQTRVEAIRGRDSRARSRAPRASRARACAGCTARPSRRPGRRRRCRSRTCARRARAPDSRF